MGCEIRAGRAIAGKPQKQTFLDHKPYLAYYDRGYTCEDCHNDFVFSAREQQYWYEGLQFWVQSCPEQCLTCRKMRRTRQEAAREIQEQLAQLDLQNPHQLLHLAELYLTTDNPQKAGEYLVRARKRAIEQNELAALSDQMELLQFQIKI